VGDDGDISEVFAAIHPLTLRGRAWTHEIV